MVTARAVPGDVRDGAGLGPGQCHWWGNTVFIVVITYLAKETILRTCLFYHSFQKYTFLLKKGLTSKGVHRWYRVPKLFNWLSDFTFDCCLYTLYIFKNCPNYFSLQYTSLLKYVPLHTATERFSAAIFCLDLQDDILETLIL